MIAAQELLTLFRIKTLSESPKLLRLLAMPLQLRSRVLSTRLVLVLIVKGIDDPIREAFQGQRSLNKSLGISSLFNTGSNDFKKKQ